MRIRNPLLLLKCNHPRPPAKMCPQKVTILFSISFSDLPSLVDLAPGSFWHFILENPKSPPRVTKIMTFIKAFAAENSPLYPCGSLTVSPQLTQMLSIVLICLKQINVKLKKHAVGA